MSRADTIAYRVSDWNRRRKWRLFQEAVGPNSETLILDVGYQDLSLQAADNFIEENYPWPRQITALGIEDPVNFSKRYPDVKVVVYDGVTFPFEDAAFDVVWSNAVLEHVGDRKDQLHFLRECARVGKTAFVTTPNRHFPVEVHTRIPLLHWLPTPWFDWILRRVGKERFAGDYMNLLSARKLRALLSDAGIHDARVVKNRLLGPTLDFVVIWRSTGP